MKLEDVYQSLLILAGILSTVLFGIFLYRELFPEYKIYQNRYVELEELRSHYTGQSVPFFKYGVKQIVIPMQDNGPETIDRCTSCHVALQLEHFSPTKIARDFNGQPVIDEQGNHVLEENENYIWGFVGENQQHLKVAKIGDHEYDMTKVLAMHPLIGRETRPFEFHPMEEYGCTSCHSGNGRGLTTEKAHGPVFDGTYAISEIANKPQFLEVDEKNDPFFSKVYNDKPGHELLFQTTPILPGHLIQSRCVQCHQPTSKQINNAFNSVDNIKKSKVAEISTLQEGLLNEQAALIDLIETQKEFQKEGVEPLLNKLNQQQNDFTLPEAGRKKAASQYQYVLKYQDKDLKQQIQFDLIKILGSQEAVQELENYLKSGGNIQTFAPKEGPYLAKQKKLNQERESLLKLQTLRHPLNQFKVETHLDQLTENYQRGEELYISQACYACHRIAGLARGGVGPELTAIGHSYPWYIKESITWPQADLRTSVMPNMRLDHEELEDLMTFLLAQRQDRKSVSEVERRTRIKAWEEGEKIEFEKSISPAEIKDLNTSMTLFATEGCAACHRLEGFKSNVGFSEEKDPEKLYLQRQWFRNKFPKDVLGSHIVTLLTRNADEIDQKIIEGMRKDSILEKIEAAYPGVIESYYSNFKYAARAHNHLKNPEEVTKWKERVRRVLMMYIQEYGLGRIIGPPISYSGIYRSDQWLMEHFWNPSSHVAKSIMPAFPFDNSKFLALTYMLNELGKRNKTELREVWNRRGFNPAVAYEHLCSNCHGPYLQGNGPVASWIYPVPKNLRNAIFLRNQTKGMVKNSITHGIKGGPMAPWGEVGSDKQGMSPVLTENEIDQLVDWIFSDLSGEYIKEDEDVLKWKYTPEDALEELHREGDTKKLKPLSYLPSGSILFAATDPWVPAKDLLQTEDPWQPKEGYPQPLNTQDVFNIDEKSSPDGKRPAYYIKEKYYTDQNLLSGQEFFMKNCSICHGREGDGTGLRAGTMQDAKPRMLTNLDWIETRDDLRLLQSIKYGVAGTSMTAWGDATTSLQRLQLVMFIRSLSWQQKNQEQLSNAIYNAFDSTKWALEKAGIENNKKIDSLEKEYEEVRNKREQSYISLEEGKENATNPVDAYSQEISLLQQIDAQKESDQPRKQLEELINQRKQVMNKVGNTILNMRGTDIQELLKLWLQIIQANGNDFQFTNGKLVLTPPQPKQIETLEGQLLQAISAHIQEYTQEKVKLQGKLSSQQRNADLKLASEHLESYERLQNQVVAALAEAKRLREQEQKIYTGIK